jgi:hypothetical protein
MSLNAAEIRRCVKQSVLFDRFGDRQTRLRRPPSPQQQHRLEQLAPGLRQGQRREVLVVKRGFPHDPIDEVGQAVRDLGHPLGIDRGRARAR